MALSKEQCAIIARNVKAKPRELCVDCGKEFKKKKLLVLVDNMTGDYHFTCMPCWHDKYNKQLAH